MAMKIHTSQDWRAARATLLTVTRKLEEALRLSKAQERRVTMRPQVQELCKRG